MKPLLPNSPLPSLQARLISRGLRRLIKPRKLHPGDVPMLRTLMLALTRSSIPRGLRLERSSQPRGEWILPEHARHPPRRGRALLYLHGGGYICGAPRSHRALTTRLAKKLNIPVFALDYRLAPEHPFPAALEDAETAYAWLLRERGLRPDRIWLAGDSAGGGLALALLLRLKQKGLPMPAAAALFSPWADLALRGASYRENIGHCAWFMPAQMRMAARLYAGSAALDDALVSPLHGDLHGLPPLILHVSDSELLRDDALSLAGKARAAGVMVQCKQWHGLPHAWPNFAGLMPEADLCLAETCKALELT